MKIVTVVGARPQFIKAAAVSRVFAGREDCAEVMIHTGQHFDANMSDVFFQELEIPKPAYHLGVGGGTHGQNTGRMIEGIESVLLEQRPDALLVYGDTDSTLAGALAAVKLHVPVVHVEAGLRSFNLRMPEEINRRLTDHVSSLLLTPNEQGIRNLAAEGIRGAQVINVGDVMYDAALHFGVTAEQTSSILEQLHLAPSAYWLATIHRQENTDDRLRLQRIFDGMGRAAVTVVLPLHPRTRKRIADMAVQVPGNVRIIEPLGYIDMVMLEKHAALIVTDSGGVQKEAYFHRVPCLTLRDETEWVELLDMGWNRLAAPMSEGFLDAFEVSYSKGSEDHQPYGSGQASLAVIKAILTLGQGN
ncbi:UDP-N-acetylglucosamine 2-epimerase (non-hydrolyzing) [Pseudomonas sichuanensis]|uniref:non-hydrolyzing UDP-N-acetylglucosamine 2-epimerase n=1 Tax=Pseudomonas sichuanensis TaxID=2213015 RepID=UPI00244771D0|nr:UDP-N-acetylglucosamine 2-epimerase (non-hydrolyzing) [Pseudomonas sichuanensis]MDH0732180.1 UDP-N-acetylglucosamine 2-epimerase (non-hydrolyzing) [Pseudomonas sichuanensis]MDH1584891.1 UDP-N-acetylglucosamine 2-epimerase (non-hydrolyzing) [Pseudomonas sichuanensis]MDH1592887.1 UDP-N-acetylglucosamine 2-epimerase (non-hydrolyzing) [Pseudomonas sichuanensis]MDH1599834.1 UDP-N-acetylglucosamine 2-epimerase (non-hydrolyzing) [Pseudomonas sichuanensis]